MQNNRLGIHSDKIGAGGMYYPKYPKIPGKLFGRSAQLKYFGYLKKISDCVSLVRGCYFNSITSVVSFGDQGQEVVDFWVNLVFFEANINLIKDILIF